MAGWPRAGLAITLCRVDQLSTFDTTTTIVIIPSPPPPPPLPLPHHHRHHPHQPPGPRANSAAMSAYQSGGQRSDRHDTPGGWPTTCVVAEVRLRVTKPLASDASAQSLGTCDQSEETMVRDRGDGGGESGAWTTTLLSVLAQKMGPRSPTPRTRRTSRVCGYWW